MEDLSQKISSQVDMTLVGRTDKLKNWLTIEDALTILRLDLTRKACKPNLSRPELGSNQVQTKL